jgi:hypothetical protein
LHEDLTERQSNAALVRRTWVTVRTTPLLLAHVE